MISRPARLLAAGAAAVILLTACTGDPESEPSGAPSVTASAPTDLAAFYDQDVRWGKCPDTGGFFDDSDETFECTTIMVPRDYDDPGAGSIGLAALRRKADNPRGSLLVNPGGPGSSAADYARAARVIVTPQVLEAYDIVGFDPRGAGQSEPVDCVDDATLDGFFAQDPTPDTPAEEQSIADASAQWGLGCQARSPQVAPYIDTVAAARDMDIVRAVVGDEKLTYMGKSYGTFLGATYAELFPEKVGRVVLDGVLPSSLDADEMQLGQARGFEVALRRFVADCITQEDCPLPRDEEAGVARIQQFLDELDANPLPGVGDRMLTEGVAVNAIANYLYAPPSDWEILRYGLQYGFEGDGSVLMNMMDDRAERNPDGTYASNAWEAFMAITCLDRPGVGGIDHARQLATEWASEAPFFGEFFAWGTLTCWEWPMGAGTAEAAGDPPVIRAEGAAPILVVSTTYDPATPHEWGVQVADELADATLLTYDGDGHTAYTQGSSCIDRAVDAYLLDGTMPAEGTVCRADADGGEGTGA